MWYLTPQLIVFALADKGPDDKIRQGMGKALFKCQVPETVPTGKPDFPDIQVGDLQSVIFPELISEKSWLMFRLLNINCLAAKQWLKSPVHSWPQNEDYTKFKNFVQTAKVVNDLAERGIKLMSDYMTNVLKKPSVRHCFRWLSTIESNSLTSVRVH